MVKVKQRRGGREFRDLRYLLIIRDENFETKIVTRWGVGVWAQTWVMTMMMMRMMMMMMDARLVVVFRAVVAGLTAASRVVAGGRAAVADPLLVTHESAGGGCLVEDAGVNLEAAEVEALGPKHIREAREEEQQQEDDEQNGERVLRSSDQRLNQSFHALSTKMVCWQKERNKKEEESKSLAPMYSCNEWGKCDD
jgi:hypothetical protein